MILKTLMNKIVTEGSFSLPIKDLETGKGGVDLVPMAREEKVVNVMVAPERTGMERLVKRDQVAK